MPTDQSSGFGRTISFFSSIIASASMIAAFDLFVNV